MLGLARKHHPPEVCATPSSPSLAKNLFLLKGMKAMKKGYVGTRRRSSYLLQCTCGGQGVMLTQAGCYEVHRNGGFGTEWRSQLAFSWQVGCSQTPLHTLNLCMVSNQLCLLPDLSGHSIGKMTCYHLPPEILR